MTCDGELLASAPVEGERPDIAAMYGERFARSGWRCRFPLPSTRRRDGVIGLRAVDGRGVSHACHGGRLDTLLAMLRAAQLAGHRAELYRVQCEWKAERLRTGEQLRELAARVRAMESSRFWKLRNRWFALKRALRLTSEP